ncbi:unnamed protein product [Lupinus luteus]|uniref:Uncharacterized protein n=1 Tax=Lupinus luteus TaxID=3873 RepID=A0AAV1VSI5_LUPLU
MYFSGRYNLTTYSLTSTSHISFAVFFSAMLDNTESAIARCKLATALSSISFHLSLVTSVDLPSIAVKQLSFLKIAFIFNFHRKKLLPLNFSNSYFAAINFDKDLFSQLYRLT